MSNRKTVYKPVTILLVEDDDGDAMALERAFMKARLANPIVRAVDGVEALEILQGKNGDEALRPPYVLLVDLNLPRMNGLELIEHIREEPALHDTLIFVLTTSNSDRDIDEAYRKNVAGYITKKNAGQDFCQLLELLDCYWKVVELPER